jgi:hypothetical protein
MKEKLKLKTFFVSEMLRAIQLSPPLRKWPKEEDEESQTSNGH